MRKFLFALFILIFILTFYGRGEILLRKNGNDIFIDNGKIKIVISPERGGIISSYIYNSCENIIPDKKKYMGLFMDHLWGQSWPGELVESPYKTKEIKKGKSKVELTLEKEVSGVWRGFKQDIIKGLIIEKKYIIDSDKSSVICKVRVINPTDEGKLPAYWIQNVFFIGGDYNAESDVFFRPSIRGIRRSIYRKGGNDFIKDPYAGWSAAIDTEKEEGIVFLMDYNYLDMLYNCGGNTTLEWMYDKIPIPSKKYWETEAMLIPFKGIKNITHCSKNLLCALKISHSRKEVVISHKIRSISGNIIDLEISTEIVEVLKNKKFKLPALKVNHLKDEFKTLEQKFSQDITDPLVVIVKIEGNKNGERIKEEYFDFFAGSYSYGDNIQQDMITPVFKMKKPPKKQILMRPDKIKRIYNNQLDVFFMEGLESDVYGIEKAIESMKKRVKVNLEYGYYSIGLEGPKITYFPFDYNKLMKQDLIVVGNVNLECLGKLGIEMLCDYIKNGGNILFLGGKASYGNGGIKGSIIEELLPVEVSNSKFDIKYVRNNYLIFNKNFMPQPRRKILCPYIHNVKAKKEAIILINTNNNIPFLVAKDLNGGKIFCISGAPYGKNRKIFFRWDGWQQVISRIFEEIKEK